MRNLIAILFGLLTLVLVNVSVFKKEQTARHGERLLLPLRPVDPRSLMQGDYMALAYEQDLSVFQLVKEQPRIGYLIVTKDEGDTAHSFHLDEGEPLKPNQVRLYYRARHKADQSGDLEPFGRQRPWIAPESYMFQEGQAQTYETAKYGEFRVDHQGHAVLIGLSDQNRQPLGHSPFPRPKPDRRQSVPQ